jgi:hypothetical protein
MRLYAYEEVTPPGQLAPTESRQYDPQEHFYLYDIPNPLEFVGGVAVLPMWVFSRAFCIVGNLMIDAALAGRYARYLALHEAVEIIGACLLPLAGRSVLHSIFYERSDWDRAVLDESLYPRYTYDYQLSIH